MIKYALSFFLLATTATFAEMPTQAPANDCEKACSKDSSESQDALNLCMEACKGTEISTSVVTDSANDFHQADLTDGKDSDVSDTSPTR